MPGFDVIQKIIKKHDILRLRKILKEGLDPNTQNQHGWTPIMLAAMEGDSKIIGLLLAAGGDPNRRNQFGETAVALAALKGHSKVLQFLLQNGGKLDLCSIPIAKYIKSGGLAPRVERKIIAILEKHKQQIASQSSEISPKADR